MGARNEGEGAEGERANCEFVEMAIVHGLVKGGRGASLAHQLNYGENCVKSVIGSVSPRLGGGGRVRTFPMGRRRSDTKINCPGP